MVVCNNNYVTSHSKMFLMVWKLFKQNRYQVEWYKLSVEKKNDKLTPRENTLSARF